MNPAPRSRGSICCRHGGGIVNVAKSVFVAATLASFAATATAKPFTFLWVFGDSTVDTGWYKVPKFGSNPPSFSGDAPFDAYLAPTSPHGRTGAQKWGIGKPTSSPGLISVEVLASSLGVTAFPQRHQLCHRRQSANKYRRIGVFPQCDSDPAADRQLSEKHQSHWPCPLCRQLRRQ
jgi:hypothetical protein